MKFFTVPSHTKKRGAEMKAVGIPNTLSLFYTISISILRRSILKPRKGTQGQPVSTPQTINEVILELSQVISEFNW